MGSVILNFIVLLLFVSCSYHNEKSIKVFNSSPTFNIIRDQIFKPNCYGCHSGANAQMGVDLSSYSELMKPELGIVSPGDPLNSILYLKVQSGEMPFGAPRLSDAEIKTIADWIKEGAREN